MSDARSRAGDDVSGCDSANGVRLRPGGTTATVLIEWTDGGRDTYEIDNATPRKIAATIAAAQSNIQGNIKRSVITVRVDNEH